MALTSDKLKEMTRRKLGLIKELDKNPCDERLKGELAALEAEIKGERTKIISDDAGLAAPHPAAAPTVSQAVAKEISPSPKAAGKKSADLENKANKVCGPKKLSDFF
jgi:hypothetical protein